MAKGKAQANDKMDNSGDLDKSGGVSPLPTTNGDTGNSGGNGEAANANTGGSPEIGRLSEEERQRIRELTRYSFYQLVAWECVRDYIYSSRHPLTFDGMLDVAERIVASMKPSELLEMSYETLESVFKTRVVPIIEKIQDPSKKVSFEA